MLLIVLQHPTAETVAGFGAWLKLGYCVRKGEHAVKIWAPCPPTKPRLQAWRDAGADPDNRPRTHWRLASVFAQDQVDPLPAPAVPAPLAPPIREVAGDSHQELVERLIELACDLGYVVEVCETGSCDGWCDPRCKRIAVAERLEPNGRLATLIPELGHALIGIELGECHGDTLGRAAEELVVESIAFCCCQTVGLDTSANSIPYLASWAERAPVEVLEHVAALTGRIADRIDAALLADVVDRSDTVDLAAAA